MVRWIMFALSSKARLRVGQTYSGLTDGLSMTDLCILIIKECMIFNFQLSESLSSSGVGVLCHEMFHSLGAPDLYHYTSDGISPVGSWDLMENNANPPQHMGAYMKYKYGNWISTIPTISTSGTYTLKSFDLFYWTML